MDSKIIRQKFLEYFKKRGHAIVSSSSLIPDDPSVLLTTAGMQQFKRYYTGELDAQKDFGSKSTASVQKSFRTSDIDEVGDESHLTFFEMLGNFSFGGYWKEKAIEYGWKFLTDSEKEGGLGISKDRIYVTVHESVPLGKDKESYDIWRNKIGLSENRIKTGGIEDNFWGPTGNDGPCGPTTEIYVDGVEIWNIVFNEFFSKKSRDKSLKEGWELKDLNIKGIDTGMGLERLAMVSQKVPTIFDTDLFSSITNMFPATMIARIKRIVADHIRGIVFLISDGVRPSNKEAGYVLRRLMRRVIVEEHIANDPSRDLLPVLKSIVQQYGEFYPELKSDAVQSVFEEEKAKFFKTLQAGLRELNRMKEINAKSAFGLYESFGLPYEIIKEVGDERAKNLTRTAFDREFKKHQEISRSGQEKKFGGHGLILNTGELKAGNEEELNKVLRLHTATHLLQKALREVLGNEVHQMGSDITPERTRFDFTFPRKMTAEEIVKVEELVNEKVKEDLPVQFVELPKAEAEKSGALYFFKEKYPEKVKIYYVGKDLASAWSKEFCGGPHVTHTGIIGKFKIAKEEAVGAGIRRVRGIIV